VADAARVGLLLLAFGAVAQRHRAGGDGAVILHLDIGQRRQRAALHGDSAGILRHLLGTVRGAAAEGLA
jgi:hypothetical protein